MRLKVAHRCAARAVVCPHWAKADTVSASVATWLRAWDIALAIACRRRECCRSVRSRRTILRARTDGESDQAAQGAARLGSHVVSQRDRQSGAAGAAHRRVLADARRARRDPADEPARQ